MDIYSKKDFQNKFDKKIIERAKKVKLIIADVDGVLTDVNETINQDINLVLSL